MTVAVQALSPMTVYGAALCDATDGGQPELSVTTSDGRRRVYAPAQWCGAEVAGDRGLLRRCVGPVLDVGCGPGRLAHALNRRGHTALGIDISADAVRLARARGAPALHRDVFAPLPGEGLWQQVLLADGNIGICGDPARLLRRCQELSTADGQVMVEVDPPGAVTWAGRLRLVRDDGEPSTPFPWAFVGVDQLGALAAAAGMRIIEQWTEAGRWFAGLTRM